MLHVPGIRVCAVTHRSIAVAPSSRARARDDDWAHSSASAALTSSRVPVVTLNLLMRRDGDANVIRSFVRSFASHVPHVLSRSDRLYIRDVPAACGPLAFSSLGNNELVHRSGFRSLDDDLAGRKKEREEKKRKRAARRLWSSSKTDLLTR